MTYEHRCRSHFQVDRTVTSDIHGHTYKNTCIICTSMHIYTHICTKPIFSLQPLSRSKSQPAFEISNSCKVKRKASKTKKSEPKETISDFESDPDDPKIPLLKTTYWTAYLDWRICYKLTFLTEWDGSHQNSSYIE